MAFKLLGFLFIFTFSFFSYLFNIYSFFTLHFFFGFLFITLYTCAHVTFFVGWERILLLFMKLTCPVINLKAFVVLKTLIISFVENKILLYFETLIEKRLTLKYFIDVSLKVTSYWKTRREKRERRRILSYPIVITRASLVYYLSFFFFNARYEVYFF